MHQITDQCQAFLLALWMLSTSMTPVNWQAADSAATSWDNIMVFGDKHSGKSTTCDKLVFLFEQDQYEKELKEAG